MVASADFLCFERRFYQLAEDLCPESTSEISTLQNGIDRIVLRAKIGPHVPQNTLSMATMRLATQESGHWRLYRRISLIDK
jgi:hypothetical protein